MVGQQQIWIGAGLAISAWFMVGRNDSVASGLLQGITLCVTKILALLFWPVLFAASDRKLAWTISAAILPLLAVSTFALLGANPLRGIRAEQTDFTSGNLIYYLDYLLGWGRSASWAYDLITVIALLAAAALLLNLAYRYPADQPRDRARFITAASALMLAVFMLFSKKSYADYLVFAYFPLMFVIYTVLPKIIFWFLSVLLSVTASLQGYVWVKLVGNRWFTDVIEVESWPVAFYISLIDITLIFIYTVIVYCAVRQSHPQTPPAVEKTRLFRPANDFTARWRHNVKGRKYMPPE
jgi:hypothetical protein